MSERERLLEIVEVLPDDQIAGLLALLEDAGGPGEAMSLADRLGAAPEERVSASEAQEIRDVLAEAAGDPGMTLDEFERELPR